MDMKLEVLFIPVSDVDRAKRFYEKLGFRLDIDIANKDFRGVQFTPPGSEASIIFGKGITSTEPGSIDRPVRAVYDINAARDNLIAHGVDVSEVFHYAGGPFNNVVENPRVGGRSFLLLICFVRGSGRERLAAPGDSDASSRSRVELDATTDHGRSNLGRAPTRDGRAPRPLREDACRASLVGLVRILSECTSERQQSRGGISRRRSLHGGDPSRSSPMMLLEWPHCPSNPNTQTSVLHTVGGDHRLR